MNGWLIRPREPVPYDVASRAMHELAGLRAQGRVPDLLVLLEHPPVFTGGRRSDAAHVRWSEDRIEAAGASLRWVDRGGSVTFHGPGQLVGYPILDLGRRPDLPCYLRRVEETVIRAAADAGVVLGRDPAQVGVWSGDAKVCAIGVRLARWRITLHGFGLNCDTDLSWFDAIVACGLADRTVTSLSAIAGRTISTAEMAPLVAARFAEVFGLGWHEAPTDFGSLFAPMPT